ncbi:MAG TPA: hypothetical protein VIH93_03070 [Thermoanaerobaculia bacterium]
MPTSHLSPRAALRSTALVLAVGISLLPAAAVRRAAADWLVTSEGGRVETRGPWEVKGKLVVFTAADGTLSSLRATQVDLDASRRATVESKQALADAEKAPPPAPRKSVRSITDKDVGHPASDAAKPGDSATAATPAANATKSAKPADAAGKSPVSVGNWQKADRTEKDGIELFGSLNNDSGDIQTDVGLTVTLYDDGEGLLGTAEAAVTPSTMTAHGATNFRVAFPGIYTFARAKFDIRSAGLALSPAPVKPSESAEKPPS